LLEKTRKLLVTIFVTNTHTVWIEIERGKGGEERGRKGKESVLYSPRLYIL